MIGLLFGQARVQLYNRLGKKARLCSVELSCRACSPIAGSYRAELHGITKSSILGLVASVVA